MVPGCTMQVPVFVWYLFSCVENWCMLVKEFYQQIYEIVFHEISLGAIHPWSIFFTSMHLFFTHENRYQTKMGTSSFALHVPARYVFKMRNVM